MRMDEKHDDAKTPATRSLVDRIRAEYKEMPGMKLKALQMARLCGVRQEECQAALDALVDEEFLCVGGDGAYARLTDESTARLRPAKAGSRITRHRAEA